MYIRKWEEYFEQAWDDYAQTLIFARQDKNKDGEFDFKKAVIDYTATKELFRKCFQQVIYTYKREIIAGNSKNIQIDRDTFLALKNTEKFVPSDDPIAKCFGLMDIDSEQLFYIFVEDMK